MDEGLNQHLMARFSAMMVTEEEDGKERCSYRLCKCHNHDHHNHISSYSLKKCAKCGIASYCSKESQTKDWTRHKKVCKFFAPFKPLANEFELTVHEKKELDEIMFDGLPLIHEEYSKYTVNSSSVSTAAEVFFIAGGLHAMKTMITDNLKSLNSDCDTSEGMMKRWQEVSPELISFIRHAQLGDIFQNKRYLPYEPRAPQQFRNTAPMFPIHLGKGTTIVDIGFVDFGIAFDSVECIDESGDPVTVIAYDMSPLCVAKSLVMHAMIKDHSVNPRSVIEVWCSSLWSKATLKAFNRATKTLISCDLDHNSDERVRNIIKFWSMEKTITPEAAILFQKRKTFERTEATYAMKCCSLKNELDRVRYLRYYFTKALYEDETTTEGSLVLNVENEAIGIKQICEDVFELIPARIHFGSVNTSQSVIGASIHYLESHMKKYMHLVRQNKLIFIPKLGMIIKENHDLIKEIKDAKPYIISWSNIADYIHPKEFHEIAKEISCKDTVHHLHFCNWTTRVYGTDIFDINQRMRLHWFSKGHLLHGFMIDRTIVGFNRKSPQHYRNICTIGLARKFVNKYFQYFFQVQRVNCGCFNGTTPLTLPFPLFRDVSVAHIFFAYLETGIDFGQDTYDFNAVE